MSIILQHKITKIIKKNSTCPDCGDTVYETDCGISCDCGFETLDETEIDN